MHKLLKYLREYRKESVIAPLFKMLEASFELLVPLVMARIIDIGIVNHNRNQILIMCGIMVGLGILGLACSLIAQYFAAKAAMGFGTALRKEMFLHVSNLSYLELDTLGTSKLVTRITSDINQAQAGVNLVLRLFLRSPFIVIGAVAMAFTINKKLAMIFVVLVPILSIIIYGIMMLSIPIYKKAQNNLERILLLTRENLAGVRVVRAFSRQAEEEKQFEQQSEFFMKTQLKVGRISALLNPATYVTINVGIMIVLWCGGKTVYIGTITQGQLIALINYMSQILLALLALSNLIITFTKASASAIRINEVFATKSSMREGTKENTKDDAVLEDVSMITFDQVRFAYHQDKNVLTDIQFCVKKGQIIGVIGGTGSGKSTLMQLIPRFYDTTQGAVYIKGVNVKEYRFQALREMIGIVPQKAVLFSGTIRENMKWRKQDATDQEIWAALDIAQASAFVKEKSMGLDTVLLQDGKNLSGGQRQRLTIARALVGNPQILILDDSASALDFATDAKLRGAIASQKKDMTIFLVSQRATSIRQADVILVLEDGKQVGFASHKELLQSCDVYREICASQLSGEELFK